MAKHIPRNKHSTEKQVVAFAAHIAEKFPEVITTYHLLDSTARGLLNQDHVEDPAGIEAIAAQIEHHLNNSRSPLLKNAFSLMDLTP